MDKDNIEIDDFTRILFGDTPPLFLLEVLLRTLLIYIVFMIIIRLLGKRMAGQLTITELGVMLTLGAIVAPAMQEPGIGILLGIFVLISVYLFQRIFTLWTYKNKKLEVITQGKARPLVEDGVLNLKEMKLSRITKQQVYAKLRGSKIFNLGKVERMYFEACGDFSIFEAGEVKPGLPLFPPAENTLAGELNLVSDNILACKNCGQTKECPNAEKNDITTCKTCEKDQWIQAVK